MSTRHVILALLDIKPMSGYDLFQNLKISVNSLWAATYSQIYPTLHKLEKEGLIEGKKMLGKKNRERIEYSLTEPGREEFLNWMDGPVTYLPYRDPFKLWATNIDKCSWERTLENIHRHIEINTERKATLEDIAEKIMSEEHPLIKERKQRVDSERLEEIKKSRSLIFRFLAAQAGFEIETANKILKLAKELKGKE